MGMAEELARAAEGAQERRRPWWPDDMVALLCSSCGSLVLCPMFLPAAGSSICDSANGDDGIFFFLSLFITSTSPSLFAIQRLLDQLWTTTHGRLLMGDWDEEMYFLFQIKMELHDCQKDFQVSCCFQYGYWIYESAASPKCNRVIMGGIGMHCFLV